MIDSHCHLAGEEFAGDLDAVVARARDAGRRRRARASCGRRRRGGGARGPRAARRGPRCGSAVGDPSAPGGRVCRRPRRGDGRLRRGAVDAHRRRRARRDRARLPLRLLAARRPAGGLPARSCGWRATRDLPVIIHTREADRRHVRDPARRRRRAVRGVFHCFTGGLDDGARGARSGCLAVVCRHRDVSEGRGAARGRAHGAGRSLPGRDRLAVSGAVPYRGKRNEPAFVAQVVEALADRARRHRARRSPSRSTANFARRLRRRRACA